MKAGFVIACVACAGMTLALTATWAQDAAVKAPAPAQSTPAQAAGTAAQAGATAPAGQQAAGGGVRATAMPGENHRHLIELVGNWTTAIKSTAKPGATPVETTGKSVFTMIMDGRFVVENFASQDPAGAFTGMGLYGYDNLKNEYESVWVDSTSTGMSTSTGSWDDTLKAFKWKGSFSNPDAGGATGTRSLMKKVNDTTWNFTLFEERGDTLFRTLEIVYSKA